MTPTQTMHYYMGNPWKKNTIHLQKSLTAPKYRVPFNDWKNFKPPKKNATQNPLCAWDLDTGTMSFFLYLRPQCFSISLPTLEAGDASIVSADKKTLVRLESPRSFAQGTWNQKNVVLLEKTTKFEESLFSEVARWTNDGLLKPSKKKKRWHCNNKTWSNTLKFWILPWPTARQFHLFFGGQKFRTPLRNHVKSLYHYSVNRLGSSLI